MKHFLFLLSGLLHFAFSMAQDVVLSGRVTNGDTALSGVTLNCAGQKTLSDSAGIFTFHIPAGRHILVATAVGFEPYKQQLDIGDSDLSIVITMKQDAATLGDVVVTGTMKSVTRLESPVAVEVYHAQFFKKNPTPSVFEAMQGVNGVRPQINCSVCNTGDIHINGLEGPYTMVTIDGMPIVSALSTVYGLFGIPTQLIERVEVVKGPASGLYGSEAVGGLINIITRSPEKAPKWSVQAISSSWLEHTVDAGTQLKAGKHSSLLGLHYYRYNNPVDNNSDGFTDVTLQHRVSLFNKWSFKRRKNYSASIAARYFYENRWGGQMQWEPKFAGSDSIYGEAIKTSRWELIGNYRLPTTENIAVQFSATGHRQHSYYGITPYNGDQRIFFGQVVWDKPIGAYHSLLTGSTLRNTFYDDNSVATQDASGRQNKPQRTLLPGLFVQDEWKLGEKQTALLGLRYDHHPVHGSILTPRAAYKWAINQNSVLRLNAGTGFRVVNIFTEDHAALTGARQVEIKEALRPEKSYNVNVNYVTPLASSPKAVTLDVSAWYSYFHNQILPDYDTDPDKIIYSNLSGHAISTGASANLDINIYQRLKGTVGATVQQVDRYERASAGVFQKIRPVLTERWSGTWAITYTLPAKGLTFDYTGNVYGPMRLPLASALDPRPELSPVWSIQNLQITKWFSDRWELFGGVKNLLNWTPVRNLPFLIARAADPFDKQVQYDSNGKILPTADNPYGLTFDPTYVYAPNQGRRVFVGVRFQVK